VVAEQGEDALRPAKLQSRLPSRAMQHVLDWPIATEIHLSWRVGDHDDESGLVVLNVRSV
jgi:hypothetical protein